MIDFLRGLVLFLLKPLFWLGFLALLFLAPISVFWETWDMIAMRPKATATIRQVDVEVTSRGTRPSIVYSFKVNGDEYDSDTYLPGYLGNKVAWLGGGQGASAYVPGQKTIVHYNASDPEKSCLEYGWFKWSVGPMMFAWGLAAMGIGGTLPRGRFLARRIWVALGAALCFYGAGSVLVGPSIIRPGEAPWHLLVIVAAASLLLACLNTRKSPTP